MTDLSVTCYATCWNHIITVINHSGIWRGAKKKKNQRLFVLICLLFQISLYIFMWLKSQAENDCLITAYTAHAAAKIIGLPSSKLAEQNKKPFARITTSVAQSITHPVSRYLTLLPSESAAIERWDTESNTPCLARVCCLVHTECILIVV